MHELTGLCLGLAWFSKRVCIKLPIIDARAEDTAPSHRIFHEHA